MSAAKHTPGPWVADWWYHDATGQGGWSFSAGGHRLPLCDMEMDPAKDEEPEANAKLIAASPDLLEAAQAAWNCIGELPPTQARVEVAQLLQAAIEKATGSDE